MQEVLNGQKINLIWRVNILFTFFSIMFDLSLGMKVAWFSMWLIIPLFMSCTNALQCIMYMSLYMRVQHSAKLFSILICISTFIILIKQIIKLNKNKLLNKYFKIILFYLAIIVAPIFYSVSVNKIINISIIYYLIMINLLLLFYLIKNELNKEFIINYSYGIIVSSILSLIGYISGLHHLPFHASNRFCGFMPLCNSLGISCVICISAIYLIMIRAKTINRRDLYLMVVLSLIGVMTMSKTFFITFAIVILFILINQYKLSANKKKFFKISLIVFMALSPLLLIYGIKMFDRLFGGFGDVGIIGSITTDRQNKWPIYLKPWLKNIRTILLGLGITFNYNTVFSSHSFYVGYLSKLGFVGLIALFIFMYVIIFDNKPIKLKLKNLPILVLLLIFLVEDLSYNTFNFIPFIIGISATDIKHC